MIPDWPVGTVAVLATAGEAPHAIPVSTAMRLDATTAAFALAHRRESLTRLRADPRCALTVMVEGAAFTLHGTAAEAGKLEGAVAVRMTVERVQDHMEETFAIQRGVFWHWLNADAAEKDAVIRDGLSAIR